MKNTIKLTQNYIENTGNLIDLDNIPEENRVIKRIQTNSTKLDIGDEERSVIGTITTPDIDIDQEIVLTQSLGNMKGIDVDTYFQKNPMVLFNHDFNKPVGKALKMKRTKDGIQSKTQFASTDLGMDIWTLVNEEVLRTFSIGFIPLKYITPEDPEFEEAINLLKKKYPKRYTPEKIAKVRGIIAESMLYEYSVVTVPANISALVSDISKKDITLNEDTKKILKVDNDETEESSEDKSIETEESSEDKSTEQEEEGNGEETKEEYSDDQQMDIIVEPKIKIIGHENLEPEFKVVGHDCTNELELSKRLMIGKVC